ncbi:hypothetical protein [Roseomonas haemaphysalidis]|uniref:DUF2793 domain-containing protein n=1 Tax=Roseomonas haemaphysalidis TaxID=2768162 RepID=A0ABS3KTR6_9PROT|nr:hypothetical protein [Roseomonas haemaphysalidis]MBO1080858.1 hypothetical protein [Roseomonas haemaphysalidis]
MTHTPTARAPVTDARGWPDARLPGVPPDHKHNGWHFLGHSDGTWGAYAWDATRATWWIVEQEVPPYLLTKGRYIGPCHPPAAEREAPGGVVSGWAVYAPSGAISWRSIETSRDASLGAFVGPGWRDHWPASEAVGYRCVPIQIAAAPPPPANIGGDSPSEREKALREALALADAEVVFAQQGIATSEAGTTERAMNVMARNTARDIAKAIKALLATPAEGGGT